MIANMATKDDLNRLEQKLIRLENKVDVNHKALFDGYIQSYEKLEELERKVERIEKVVDRHDIEIRVIKAAASN